jgi:ribose transport system permease protein
MTVQTRQRPPSSRANRNWQALAGRARQQPITFALVLAVLLLAANVGYVPAFVSPGQISPELGTLAPFMLAAMASTPAILAGGGGIDLSVAPLMGLSNILLVVTLMPHGLGSPWAAIPILLVIGGLIGTVNGALIAIVRFPPVIATLGVYFILGGIDLALAPNPVSTAKNWTNNLAVTVDGIPGALFTAGIALLVWWAVRRTPYHRVLLAVGGDDVAAYSAGVNVAKVRIAAYALGGMIAALAGIALTGTIQSADVTVWPQYVLIALAAVALGGTALSGGSGGFAGSALGATCVFLVQNLISAAGVSVFYLQVAYGVVLLVAVVLGSRLARKPGDLSGRAS